MQEFQGVTIVKSVLKFSKVELRWGTACPARSGPSSSQLNLTEFLDGGQEKNNPSVYLLLKRLLKLVELRSLSKYLYVVMNWFLGFVPIS